MFDLISAAMLDTRMVCRRTLLGHSMWPGRAAGAVLGGPRGAGWSRNSSMPVSSSSSPESVPSESNSPEFYASSHARIDSSYSSRVLRQCAPQLPIVGVREGMHEQHYVIVQHADGSQRTLGASSGRLDYPADLVGIEAL